MGNQQEMPKRTRERMPEQKQAGRQMEAPRPNSGSQATATNFLKEKWISIIKRCSHLLHSRFKKGRQSDPSNTDGLQVDKRERKKMRKQERLRQKRVRIELYMSLPLYQRILIRMGYFLLKVCFVILCFMLAVVLGLMVGMGIIGEGDMWDAVKPSTWQYIWKLFFP
jgi:hypothetical protein